jgi:5'-nucleotidase
MRKILSSLLFAAAIGCATTAPPPAPRLAEPVHVVLVGTTDLHGWFNGHEEAIAKSQALARYGGLPVLGGYLANLRSHTGEHVVLVDSGDLFQGTLESNLFEGEPVVFAYNALGYAAASVGNHEFDYGPVGPDSLPTKPGDDPLGALKKNAGVAKFPFLSANMTEKSTGRTPSWARRSVVVDAGGAKIGVIGLSTPDTPNVTSLANVATLDFGDPIPATVKEAADLRSRGADAIVVIAHMGGRCTDLREPTDVSSCDKKQEAYEFLSRLPPGTIDAYFAGHTHSEMRQIINGVPTLQAGAYSRGFSTLDLWVDPAGHRVLSDRTSLRPLTMICESVYSGTTLCDARTAAKGGSLVPREFEGAVVKRDAHIDDLLRPYLDKVAARRAESYGITATEAFTKAYLQESTIGDLLADALRASVPGADIALINSGSIRSDLPAGEITYGRVFEVAPFDNLISIVSLTGSQIRELLRLTTSGQRGILQVSGLRYTIDAAKDENLPADQRDRVLSVSIADGSPLVADKLYTVVMPDFLAAGGDGFAPVMQSVPPERVREREQRSVARDVIVEQLRKSGSKTLTPKKDGRITVLNPKPETGG